MGINKEHIKNVTKLKIEHLQARIKIDLKQKKKLENISSIEDDRWNETPHVFFKELATIEMD